MRSLLCTFFLCSLHSPIRPLEYAGAMNQHFCMHLALLRGRAGIITACLFGFRESWALLCLHILHQPRVHTFARTRMYCQDKHGLLLNAISIGELCASANCVTTRSCIYQQALATTSMQQHRWQWMRLSATSPSAQTRRAGVPRVLLLFCSSGCA